MDISEPPVRTSSNPMVASVGLESSEDAWEHSMAEALGNLQSSSGGDPAEVVRLLRQRELMLHAKEDQLEAKIAAMEAKLGLTSAPADGLVDAVIRRVAGAPANCAS